MKTNDVKLLDCTLRDGGYVNNWMWGYRRAKCVIEDLVKAGVDIVEVGFLRNVEEYDPDCTVCNSIEQLNYLLPSEKGKTVFSAMAMQSNYDINKLSPYSGEGIELIRVTAHDYDLEEGFIFSEKVKSLGYKVSINPINIMGYSNEELLNIFQRANDIQPYQFVIVDTFGSMRRRDLERIVRLADDNLEAGIRLGLHLHENMSLSCCLAQNFVDYCLDRSISIDASLMGMGRIPGNLPIELMADYLNEYTYKTYDLDYIMDAINDYVFPIRGNIEWGYTPAYFLSAKFNLHRNYAEFLLGKGDLTTRDINHILSRIEREKKTVFDKEYAEELYISYKGNVINDNVDRMQLKGILEGKDILIFSPGNTLNEFRDEINAYITECNAVKMAVNFIPDFAEPDFVFVSNPKRYESIKNTTCKKIVTSNVKKVCSELVIDYNSLAVAFEEGCNSLIMLLKLLKEINVQRIAIIGADGYNIYGENYYDSAFRNYTEHGEEFNEAVKKAIRNLNVSVEYLTPSAYGESVWKRE